MPAYYIYTVSQYSTTMAKQYDKTTIIKNTWAEANSKQQSFSWKASFFRYLGNSQYFKETEFPLPTSLKLAAELNSDPNQSSSRPPNLPVQDPF
jgi:hypothetical protein